MKRFNQLLKYGILESQFKNKTQMSNKPLDNKQNNQENKDKNNLLNNESYTRLNTELNVFAEKIETLINSIPNDNNFKENLTNLKKIEEDLDNEIINIQSKIKSLNNNPNKLELLYRSQYIEFKYKYNIYKYKKDICIQMKDVQIKAFNNQLNHQEKIKKQLEQKNKELQEEENRIRDSINNDFAELEETIENLKKEIDDCNKKLINKQNELDKLNESINEHITTTQKNHTDERFAICTENVT